MADENLTIKIGGDPSGFKSAVTESVATAEALNETLKNMSEIASQVFERLVGQVEGGFEAFKEDEQASRALTLQLQNQGIYTDELAKSYKEYAEHVQTLTGFQVAEIEKSQAIAQTYLGQIPVSEKLTASIADLAQQQGISLPAAAEEMGKAIRSGTGSLIRQGLSFSASSTEAERYAQVLDFVAIKAGGQAAAANQGLGSIRGLQAAYHDTQAELGERFAPAMAAVIQSLTNFITPAKDSDGALVDLKASAIAVGLVLSGVGIVLPIVAQGFLAVRAAAIALEIGAAPILGIAAAIALVVAAIVEMGLHWRQVTATVKAVVQDMVQVVSSAFHGLSTILKGALTLDPTLIKQGLAQISEAFKKVGTDASTAWNSATKAEEKAGVEQDVLKKKLADKQATAFAAQESATKALAKAQNEAIQLELEDASSKRIDLKKAEINILKELANKKNGEDKALLTKQLAEVRALEKDAQEQDIEREKAFRETELAADADYGKKANTQDVAIDSKEIAQIKATQLTEAEINAKVYKDGLTKRVKEHNTFLEEQAKYGEAYASINQFIHSEEIQGASKAFNDLSALTTSKNEELKAIGKAAAIANIAIKTAESAMNIYEGFSTIPFVGQALGIAGAAAAVIFGAEQIGTVTSAYDGGVISTGSAYYDSSPALLSKGEFVTPSRNFDEVVNSVAADRNRSAGLGDHSGGGGGNANITLALKGDLGKMVEVQLLERQRIGVSLITTKL